jgi:hypothetical protein
MDWAGDYPPHGDDGAAANQTQIEIDWAQLVVIFPGGLLEA